MAVCLAVAPGDSRRATCHEYRRSADRHTAVCDPRRAIHATHRSGRRGGRCSRTHRVSSGDHGGHVAIHRPGRWVTSRALSANHKPYPTKMARSRASASTAEQRSSRSQVCGVHGRDPFRNTFSARPEYQACSPVPRSGPRRQPNGSRLLEQADIPRSVNTLEELHDDRICRTLASLAATTTKRGP